MWGTGPGAAGGLPQHDFQHHAAAGTGRAQSGRVSVMYMYPRTGIGGRILRHDRPGGQAGGVETAGPRMCLDVLAQHLVSMANGEGYSVEDVLEILKRAYPFRDVTAEDVSQPLAMLAGDYEHRREIPVRPRVLYDRIHGLVAGDNYSRMLATAAEAPYRTRAFTWPKPRTGSPWESWTRNLSTSPRSGTSSCWAPSAGGLCARTRTL